MPPRSMTVVESGMTKARSDAQEVGYRDGIAMKGWMTDLAIGGWWW